MTFLRNTRHRPALNNMRFILLTLVFSFFVAAPAESRDFFQRTRSINLNVSQDNGQPVHHRGPTFDRHRRSNPCFPWHCRDQIIGPITNPDPYAREPKNLTACIYNVKGVLVYKREGKSCPNKYVDLNVRRLSLHKK